MENKKLVIIFAIIALVLLVAVPYTNATGNELIIKVNNQLDILENNEPINEPINNEINDIVINNEENNELNNEVNNEENNDEETNNNAQANNEQGMPQTGVAEDTAL